MVGLDLNTIKHALQLARDNGLDEVELCAGTVEFRAVLTPIAAPRTAARHGEGGGAQGSGPDEHTIGAPQVGYFAAAPNLQLGQAIQQGEVIGTITALGIGTDVESPVTGLIEQVLATTGAAVEYGEPIAKVKVN